MNFWWLPSIDGPNGDLALWALWLTIAVVPAICIYLIRDARRPKYTHALDTVRLSWLESTGGQLVCNPVTGRWCVIVEGKPVGIDFTLRSAIDQARGA